MQRTRAEAMNPWARWDDLDVEDRRRVVQSQAEQIEVGLAVMEAAPYFSYFYSTRAGWGHVPVGLEQALRLTIWPGVCLPLG